MILCFLFVVCTVDFVLAMREKVACYALNDVRVAMTGGKGSGGHNRCGNGRDSATRSVAVAAQCYAVVWAAEMSAGPLTQGSQ